jgi:hypothetical protein
MNAIMAASAVNMTPESCMDATDYPKLGVSVAQSYYRVNQLMHHATPASPPIDRNVFSP